MVLPAKFPESQASLHSLHCSVGDYLTCYHTWASYIRAGLHRLTYVATPPPFAVQTGGSHKEAHFMQTQQSSLVLVETLTTAADWAATKIRNSHWFERYRFWICCRFWDVSQPALTVVRIELPGWVPAFVRKGQLLWKPPSWVIRAGNSRNTSPQEEKAPRCETELGMLRNKACMNAWPQDCCMLGLGNSRHWECFGWGETVFQTVYLSEIVIPAPFLDTLFNPGNESERAFWCWSDSAADLILPCPFFSSYFSSHLVLFSALKVILSQGHHSLSEGGLSLSTQMSIPQWLWHQPKQGTGKADTNVSSESPSLLLNHDCVCSLRCLDLSSPAWASASSSYSVLDESKLWNALCGRSSQLVRLAWHSPLHHLAKPDLCLQSANERYRHPTEQIDRCQLSLQRAGSYIIMPTSPLVLMRPLH